MSDATTEGTERATPSEAIPAPKKPRPKKPAEKAEPAASESDKTSPKRKRRRRRKSAPSPTEPVAKAAPTDTSAEAESDATADSLPPVEADSQEQPKRRAKKSSQRRKTPAPQTAAAPEAEVTAKKELPDEVEPPPRTTTPPKKKKPAASPQPTDGGGFGSMGLSDVMLASLDEAGYIEPTEIQAGLIPMALEGIDLMGQARTGTGKTAAFGIPILERLGPHKRGAPPQALVLVPTRELAVQVRDECAKLAAGSKSHVVAVYGGKPIRQQIDKLHRGVEMVVGTPGRVLDLMARGALLFGDIRFVVLDEADRMLDIGFRPDIEKILRRCPQARQTLLLSATIPPPVHRLAQRYMRDPKLLNFSPKDLSVDTIEQFYFTVDPEKKFDLLVKLIEREQPTQAIVFCRTKRGTDKVQRRLARKARSVDTIHGDLSQSLRDRAMRGFRAGTTQILVATDVVGRGIDVTNISHIINYDIPQFCDDYIHRVGRTGRMGREGVAFTFVTPEEGNELTRIEMRINLLLKRDEIADISSGGKPEADPNAADGMAEASRDTYGNAEPAEEAKPAKPVFGKRTRRYRRGL